MATEIKVCMGSACFAKGNQQNLEYIKNYLKEHDKENDVEITGALCENKCSDGPRVIINGVEHQNVTVEILEKILKTI